MAAARTGAEILDRIREMGPLIRSHQPDAERLGRIAEPVMAALFDLDLFRVLLPPDLGGAGLDLATSLRLVEEVAYYDGSTGWVAEIGIGGMVRLGFLPTDQARALATSPRGFIAGTFPPSGRAMVVPGGYLVSGRWGFASGIHHASWIAAGCVVSDGDEPRTTEQGASVVIHALVRREAATILDDWHVGGMRGTGSTSYTLDGVFVPAELAVFPSNREYFHPAPIFRILDATLGTAFASVAIGVARAAIDGLIDLATAKVGPHGDGSILRDRASAQYEVAKAQAMVESARLNLFDAVNELAAAAERGEALTLPLRARSRRAAVHAAETAAAVVDQMYRTAGAAALFEAGPFERSLRDVHAIIAQIWLQRSALEDAGRVAFGLTPRNPMF